jgi:hypothetical protein
MILQTFARLCSTNWLLLLRRSSNARRCFRMLLETSNNCPASRRAIGADPDNLFSHSVQTVSDRIERYQINTRVAETYLKGLMVDCACVSAEPLVVRAAGARVQARGQTFFTYLANNIESIVDCGRRHRSGLPISSSRAEASVDDIANARTGKRRRMRWSPRGTHRVAVTIAAVLDGRLTVAHSKRAA